MKLAPIILFVYNRPWHTQQTVEALKKNELAKDSELFIFSDLEKNSDAELKVKEVRDYIKAIDGFKMVKIIKRDSNFGLAKSVISGVTEIINEYGKVIIMEDDLLTSETFLDYMNNALENFKDDRKIFGITGYNHPPKLMNIPGDYKADIYFNPRAGSWSWATWKDRWDSADWEVADYDNFKNDKKARELFNSGGSDMSRMLDDQMNGKIDSWAIRWCFTVFKNDALYVYPIKSYVDNIGLDGTGVHCGKVEDGKYENRILNRKKKLSLPESVSMNKEIMDNFRNIYRVNAFMEYILDLARETLLYKYYEKIINNN